MDENKYFDNMIKEAVKDNVIDIKPSKDIFEASWREKTYKEQNEFNKRNFNIKRIAAAVISFVVILGSIVSFSPSVRAGVVTLFGLDNDGNVVEKSGDDTTHVSGNWAAVNEDDKEEIESLVGFDIDFPKAVGDYSLRSVIPLVIVDGVKYSGSDAVVDKLRNAEDYTKTYEELSNIYPVHILLLLWYTEGDSDDNYISISVDKSQAEKKEHDDTTIITIEGIDCEANGGTVAKYPSKMINESCGISDVTKKPDIVDVESIGWDYDGMSYDIDLKSDKTSDQIVDFIEDYIRALKSE